MSDSKKLNKRKMPKVSVLVIAKLAGRATIGTASAIVARRAIDYTMNLEEMDAQERVIYETGVIGIGFAVQGIVGEAWDELVDTTDEVIAMTKAARAEAKAAKAAKQEDGVEIVDAEVEED